MSDDDMIGPGMHEHAAESSLADDHAADAQVHALLAIASAVNRLAIALESLVHTQIH